MKRNVKKILVVLSLSLIGLNSFACETTFIKSFAGYSSVDKIKDKCEIVRQETSKIVLSLDYDKDIICLSKVEKDYGFILTYDDAGIIRQVIFKKCNKNKIKNKLYCLSKTVLHKEIK